MNISLIYWYENNLVSNDPVTIHGERSEAFPTLTGEESSILLEPPFGSPHFKRDGMAVVGFKYHPEYLASQSPITWSVFRQLNWEMVNRVEEKVQLIFYREEKKTICGYHTYISQTDFFYVQNFEPAHLLSALFIDRITSMHMQDTVRQSGLTLYSQTC